MPNVSWDAFPLVSPPIAEDEGRGVGVESAEAADACTARMLAIVARAPTMRAGAAKREMAINDMLRFTRRKVNGR
jgi:hypothetical protein